jgi:hypothetical protein
MSIKVKFNRLPKIIAALPVEAKDGVKKSTKAICAIAVAKVPVDKTILARNTKPFVDGLHGEIRSGVYLGHGFYAGFVEFGANQPGGRAQPYMIPAATAGQPLFVENMTRAVRKACKA